MFAFWYHIHTIINDEYTLFECLSGKHIDDKRAAKFVRVI